MQKTPARVYLVDEGLKKKLVRLNGTELHRWLNQAFDRLKENPSCGTRIRRELIPREYVKRYRVNNLWKYDLPEGWRVIYTITRMGPLAAAVILEWLPHKKYERRFGY